MVPECEIPWLSLCSWNVKKNNKPSKLIWKLVWGEISKCEHPHNLIKWCPHIGFEFKFLLGQEGANSPSRDGRHSELPQLPKGTCLSGWHGPRCLHHHRQGLQTPSGVRCESSSPHCLRVPLGQALGDDPQNAVSAESTVNTKALTPQSLQGPSSRLKGTFST